MSQHYNNNNNPGGNSTANSWQSRPNNASSGTSLFGHPDLVANSNNSYNNNSSGGGNSNNNNPSGYNPAAASLLAQFAVNGVSFGNLAASLPATLLGNQSLLGQQGLGAVANASQAYQWHASAQNNNNLTAQNQSRIHIEAPQQQQSLLGNAPSSVGQRISDQRIVSIDRSSSSNTTNSYNKPNNDSYKTNNDRKSFDTRDNNNRNNTNSNSSSDYKSNNNNSNSSSDYKSNNNNNERKSFDNPKSLMGNNSQQTPNRYSTNNNNSSNSSHSSAPAKPKPTSQYNNNTNTNNNSNNTKYDSRDNNNRTDNSRDNSRDTNKFTSNNTTNNNNRSNGNDSTPRNDRSSQSTASNNNNDRSRSISNNNSTSKSSNVDLTSALAQATSNLAVQNPLAQALLTQLAATSNSSTVNNQALVAALAVVNASVTNNTNKPDSSNKPLQNNSNSTRTNNNVQSNNQSTKRRSRSPSNTKSQRSFSRTRSQSKLTNRRGSRSPSKSIAKRLGPNHATDKSSSSSHYKSSNVSSSSSSSKSSKFPKFPIDILSNNVSGIKSRYSQLYIPSDFISSINSWQTSLPIDRTLKFNNRCLFHIMKKEAALVGPPNLAIFDAPDADYKWSVKVMLLAMPSINELHKSCSVFAEDLTTKTDRLEHPNKVIQFLVGSKGKHELMALGGAWSKSLDGPDPATNTQTLKNTAIRTVKALTGIDLASCTQWFRFLDIKYNRNEDFKTVIQTTNSESNSEATATATASLILDDQKHLENTVIFVPNVWSLMPNTNEYLKLTEQYTAFIENPPIVAKPVEEVPAIKVEEVKAVETVKAVTVQEVVKKEVVKEVPVKEVIAMECEPVATKPVMESPSKKKPQTLKAESTMNKELMTTDLLDYDENDDSESKLEPTHWAEIDLKKMKVDELRTELMARDLDTRGLKGRLVIRLQEALDTEKANEEANGIVHETSPLCVLESSEGAVENHNDQPKSNDLQEEAPLSNQNDNENGDVIYTHVNDEFENEDAKPEVPVVVVATKTDAEIAAELAKQKEKEEKELEAKAKLEKAARADRERLYKLPIESPHIIVHPSEKAKSGRFEVQMVSLSHLLDYRRDDNKESAFEVNLFAEYFNEMLVRDEGFVIYKYVLGLRTEKDRELVTLATNKRKMSEQEKNGDDSKRAKHNEADANKSTETPAIESAEPEKMDTTTTTSTTTPPVVAITTPSKQIVQLVKPKPKTIHRELLLAFNFFDVNRTSTVYERDLEDLFLSIGLCLSRSKVRALLSKLSMSKDGVLNYRSLTDKTPKEAQTEIEAMDNFKMPEDSDIVNAVVPYQSSMQSGKSVFDKDTGVIELNGNTVDVIKTLKSLDQSENMVGVLEAKLRESIEEIDRLKTTYKTCERVKNRLASESSDYQKKFRDQQRSTKEAETKYSRYKDLLIKTKSAANKISDEISSELKRGMPTPVTVNGPKVVEKKVVEVVKKEDPVKVVDEVKVVEEVVVVVEKVSEVVSEEVMESEVDEVDSKGIDGDVTDDAILVE